MLQIKVFYLFILAAAPAATLPLPTDPFSSYTLSETHEQHLRRLHQDHPHQQDPFEAFLNNPGGTSHDQRETHPSEHSQTSSAHQSPTISPPHIERQNDHQHQATPQHPSIGSNTHPPPATTPPHPSTSSNLNTPHQSPATPQHPSVGSNTHPPPATTPPHPSTSSNLNTPHQAPATSHHPSTSSNIRHTQPNEPAHASQTQFRNVVNAVRIASNFGHSVQGSKRSHDHDQFSNVAGPSKRPRHESTTEPVTSPSQSPVDHDPNTNPLDAAEHHTTPLNPKKDDKPYKCDKLVHGTDTPCTWAFISKSKLKQHIEGSSKLHPDTYVRKKNHICADCGQTFDKKYKLDKHTENGVHVPPEQITFQIFNPETYPDKVAQLEYSKSDGKKKED